MKLIAVWQALRSSYWFIPTLMAMGASAIAYALVSINDIIPPEAVSKLRWLYAGGPEGARSVLSTIAGSIVTVAGTTFSVTIAALALTSSQFGPRLLRTFRRDTGNQIVLGVFLSTFLYCVLILRTIRGTDDGIYVPHFAVSFGVLLAIISLVVLIYFIHHSAASIQVSNLMSLVSEDLMATVKRNLRPIEDDPGARLDEPKDVPGEETILKAKKAGYLLRVDYDALVRSAADKKCVVTVHLRPGNLCLSELRLATVHSASTLDEDDAKDFLGHFYIGSERTPEQDPEHGFQQLAEVGVRALSPGINDPFTAMSCLDQLTEGMAEVACRRIPSRFLFDEHGQLRVVAVSFTYEELVVAGFQHIRKAARANREVLAHLSRRLQVLVERAEDPDLRIALARQLVLTEEQIRKCDP